MFCHVSDAYFELLILQTTSNFPDVMLDIYKVHSWTPIFFILFLIINWMILTNMLLGVFYSFYKNQI